MLHFLCGDFAFLHFLPAAEHGRNMAGQRMTGGGHIHMLDDKGQDCESATKEKKMREFSKNTI